MTKPLFEYRIQADAKTGSVEFRIHEKGKVIMKWFRHKQFNGKRDYECTNLAYCYAPEPPNEHWQETQFPLAKITTMSFLYRQGDAHFYGWL